MGWKKTNKKLSFISSLCEAKVFYVMHSKNSWYSKAGRLSPHLLSLFFFLQLYIWHHCCFLFVCPFFPAVSTPRRSRQMVALPESGFAGGFFLLRVFFVTFSMLRMGD